MSRKQQRGRWLLLVVGAPIATVAALAAFTAAGLSAASGVLDDAAGGILAFALAILVIALLLAGEGITNPIEIGPWSDDVIAGASRLLPADARREYREEWAAWMIDLRADGTPRVRRWIELLSIILVAAPRLAITLRTTARRAVDR
ncbi:hypothetical protein ADK67_10820 [Saccharothrix sp. NRRL B-16348]|nr:hypothetical protein ADK67_10820 [Saccharothrix sp. NRRL B-16348]